MARPKTFEEMADRMEITDLLHRYVTGQDDNRFRLLDDVFTPDAHLSYPIANLEGDYASIMGWIEKNRPSSRTWLHLLGNVRIELDGDTAKSVSSFFCTLVQHDSTARQLGGEYYDTWVRTPDGWRICDRYEHCRWQLRDVVQAADEEVRDPRYAAFLG